MSDSLPSGRPALPSVENDVLDNYPLDMATVRPVRGAAVASVLVHVALLVLAFGVARHTPSRATIAEAVTPPSTRLVWLVVPGPAGGGGGGGTRSVAPPQPAEAPGRDHVTVPVAPRPAPALHAADSERVMQPAIAAVPFASGAMTMAGVIEQVSAYSSESQGTGDGAGADRGIGSGVGPGRGSGVGDGTGGNTGGDAYRAGNGVTAPRLLQSIRPHYTPDAMRARITGVVVLDCVVDANGQVERCRLQRSLDPRHGLDEEAIKAAYLWTFAPGTRLGKAVPVFVRIELSFSIQ